ncbi:MAG: double-strand break repair helicase AddA [Pseudomonadota bacterium]
MTTPAARSPAIRLNERQREASAADRSVWVTANAGSGKTFVLATRVLRLLLAGTPPAQILCLTFTKAAAAEMSNRVFEALRQWAVADDETLVALLENLEDRLPAPDELIRARTLFTDALETPGGLKIQTIHAFCTALLQRFPFEADVPARFGILEDQVAVDLMRAARDRVFQRAVDQAATAEGKAMASLATNAQADHIGALVDEITRAKSAFRDWIGQRQWPDIQAEIGRTLGVGQRPLSDIEAEVLQSPHIVRVDWPTLIAAMKEGGKRPSKHADKLAALAAKGGTDTDDYLAFFLKANHDPIDPEWMFSKTWREEHPRVLNQFTAEADRLANLYAVRAAAIVRDASIDLFTVARAVIAAYEREKRARAAFDHDDLIDRAQSLLTQSSGAAWVLFKLDNGIDHILVDEAQDTSPAQWTIVSALAEEFFSGEAARKTARTLFVVGDEKQSIFSFQGADPDVFDRVREDFRNRIEGAEQMFRNVPLDTSFRTLPAILQAVDTVFQNATLSQSVTADGRWLGHTPVRRDPGVVEIWPPVIGENPPEPDVWTQPFDAPKRNDPTLEHARRIAAVIAHWTATGEPLAPGSTPIRPGDIMILVRKRKALAAAILRELKASGVPVAGADRLRLKDHIAALDLMAACRFALLPEDDLNLAALLKSPLCGLEDDDLIAIAPGRRGTLWQALRGISETRGDYRLVVERLQTWLARADQVSPFRFVSEILGAEGGRRAFRARLGAEADDVLDEILAMALRHGATEATGLQGFCDAFDLMEKEIKRDMEQGGDSVRLLTIHGAKGLEAPLVILADTFGVVRATNDPKVMRIGGETGPFVWKPGGVQTPETEAAIEEARARRDDEERRLLYVALTRARDRLVITGHHGPDAPKPLTWYQACTDALADTLAPLADPYDAGFDVLRTPVPASEDKATKADARALTTTPQMALPAWLGAPALVEPPARRFVAPSAAWMAGPEDDAVDEAPPLAEDPLEPAAPAFAARKGRIIHTLLEQLPDRPQGDWARLAHAYATRHLAPDDPAGAAQRITDETLSVLQDPELARLFGSEGRAEVPVTGPLGASADRMAAGIVDRLLVTPDRIVVADFKTNARVPERVDDVPSAYLSQMAVYTDILGRIYPDRDVEALLIWTTGPTIMPLPADVLHGVLNRLAP